MRKTSEKIWKEWSAFALERGERAPLRKGTGIKKAAPWIEGRSHPALPVKMLSKVEVYDGWVNSHNLSLAQKIVKSEPKISFRDLVDEMLVRMDAGETTIPYIWWVWLGAAQARVLYEDLLGVTFIKLSGKWEMVCSIRSAGVLAGAQGISDYEALPPNSYFLPWENEGIARGYANWS